jgi:hypothetical protein
MIETEYVNKNTLFSSTRRGDLKRKIFIYIFTQANLGFCRRGVAYMRLPLDYKIALCSGSQYSTPPTLRLNGWCVMCQNVKKARIYA